MLQKKNEGILFSAEIRVVGSYTDRLLIPEFSSARQKYDVWTGPFVQALSQDFCPWL